MHSISFPVYVILLFLGQIHAQTPTVTVDVNVVSTITLIPPYASGPATYYASALGSNKDGTSYAITCIPPTSTPASADPCQTSRLGKATVTFFQGPNDWQVLRSSDSGYHRTDCVNETYALGQYTSMATASGCDAVPSALLCNVYNDKGEEGIGGNTTQEGMCELGFAEQQVLMVEALPTTTFTDIGRSATTQGPVQTVTLYKTGGNTGTRGRAVAKSAVVGAVAAFALVSLP